ncbi:acetyl-CoA decarbonylase/synthase complex subunit gamma [Acetonema longum]|uniref:Acetyl-CoA decarbonylase/synthase complex subunit gamma n=1 Tax=Acetonema longum DSM 6540 TaxID=1009370 RepID=F7NGT2_9FIRM|nr:acetyl-CoA decarbonylase/synthase complex subunit gamma [Acetonema longum]EGO64663.1 acetyl-CoA decarbonylase/synthase complex subunit gamma [Acetonema longum DSM 6540]
MALTGLDIFKQLPKKNCKECGAATCMAFAMALAAAKTSLDLCPYVSEEAKENLGAASAPPIRLVTVGSGEHALALGDETVIFRHDKTFFHPTGLAISVNDTLPLDQLAAKIGKINDLKVERVGQQLSVNLIAVIDASHDPANYKTFVAQVAEKTALPLILVSDNPAAFEAALPGVAVKKPLIYAAAADNYQAMAELAKTHNCPLAVKGKNLADTAELVEKIAPLYKELVIDTGSRSTSQVLADQTQIRRLAVKKKFRPFGYPTITFTAPEDPREEVIQASVYVAKFAGIIVMKADEKSQILPLLAWRQNVFTDPQKPIAVEAKIYEIGAVTPASPVYVCTNFALTYFAVEGEVAASKIPGYILPVDTDGTSVLTSWASGKFSADSIADFLESSGIKSKIDHTTCVIPGHTAVLSGKLKEKSGWNVLVGPQEAAGIPTFAKARFA